MKEKALSIYAIVLTAEQKSNIVSAWMKMKRKRIRDKKIGGRV